MSGMLTDEELAELVPSEFIRHDTPSTAGVSPGQTSAVGTLSINCIGTRQYIGVGMNLARIERLNLIIDWRR